IDRALDERTLARSHSQDFDFAFVPDGSRVVYLADGELFSVRADASAPEVLLSTEVGGITREFALAPDGARAVYRSQVGNTTRLLSVPADGSAAPIALDDPLLPSRSVASFAIAPDSSRVVFLQPRESSGRLDLFTAPMGGGALTRLYTPVDAADSVATCGFSLDGVRVVFTRGPDAAGTTAIHTVPADGSAAPVELQRVGGLVLHALTPDGARLVYTRSTSTAGDARLLSAPADRNAPPTLLDAHMNGIFTLSPDSARAVYKKLDSNDLFSVPASGGASPVRLNQAVPPGGGVWFDFRITAAGSVVFRTDPETLGSFELFDAALDGSRDALELSSALARVVVGDVGAFRATDEAAFFVADQERDDVNELWRVDLDGARRVTRLSSPMVEGRSVTPDFVVSPNGRWVIYRSDEAEDDKLELHVVRADGRSQPLK